MSSCEHWRVVFRRQSAFHQKTALKRGKLPSSNPKRCGSIQRLADNLMGCSSFAAPGTMAVENTELSASACVYPDDTENIPEADRVRRRNSTVVRHYSFKTLTEQKDEDSKYYTKRPPVDRLNPELVQKVEQIVSGDLNKRRESEFYADKNRKAERLTQRLPKNDIEEMEKKLEHSGMGVLYAKKEHISSQDEKIIRANAAYARKEAESGFSNEEKLSRFKEFDNKIAKSEEVMKRRDLAGVDPFEKWRLSNPYPSAMPENDVPKSSVPPPPPPRKTREVHQNDGVVMRPVAPVQPKRHMSAPVMPSLYDSVNARRQETCRLCEKVVYLAERMQVESMFVHKNCFRCAYCNQPLRLGEYGKDKDLEFRYPRRFFCKTHLRAPLKEKIARIERAVRLLEKSSGRDQELLAENAQIDESPTTEAPVVTPTSGDPLMQCSATLSFFSPEQLRDRTVQRMRDCGVGGPISPVSEVASVDERTPERAEFSSQLRKSSLPSVDSKKPELELSGSNSSFEEDEFDDCDAYSSCSLGSNGGAGRTSDDRLSVSGEESSASEGEEDALEEGDLEELEKTVLQFSDENPERPLTDAQVVSVINKINERRSTQMTTPRSSCESSAQNGVPEEKFYTPRELFFRDMSGSSNQSSASPGSANGKMLVEDNFSTPLAAPNAWDIRKRKAADLERLRTESRLKAKLKTDEELGLEKSMGDRRSMPVIELSKASITDPSSPPKPRDRGMSLSNTPTPNPRVTRSLTVGAGDVPVQTVEKWEEPKTYDKETCTSQPSASMPRPPSTGLLSRLFSPDAIRKPKPQQPQQTTSSPVNPERIHSESRKETNMLGSTFRRFKLKREEHSARDTPSSSAHSSPCTSPHPVLSSSGGEPDNRDVPCAAVAPSPRLEAGPSNSPTHISVNERNIRLFQKRAEKIRRQHDDERRRSAQEIQRGLQECEIRLEEIKSKGQSLEMKLLEDPENAWAMESWFALVHEREVLKCKEEMLRLSKREMELEVKYRDLNLRFKQLGEGMNDNLAANSDLLAAMLAVVEEKKEVNRLNEDAKQCYKKVNPAIQAMREKGRNFQKFKPIFSCM
ncbi:hypothetical protein Y032_0406g888 [Ancylostoma ceylanicum]|uniref:LIM zinc-binding domain-containing protein n=1 Tax=Ancylostoma ceylanicum TaxID=53326 RepID=A0A016X235_9BILA|nr:hypothetical protein Y032_0406g888 [Ancylostoma ceylanicum]